MSKHKHCSFFKRELQSFKSSIQDSLKFLDSSTNSISLDSPQFYSKYRGENALREKIPSNFFDNKALDEASRGNSYSIFPELIGPGKCTLPAIKEALKSRGVDDELQNQVINLMLQCRVGIFYGLNVLIEGLIYEKSKIVISSDNDQDKNYLSAEVIESNNEKDPVSVILKIKMPMQTFTSNGIELVCIVDTELRVSKNSIYLNKITYNQVGDSEISNKIFKAVSTDENYSVLNQIWDFIKNIFFKNIDNELELSLSSPVPTMKI
ncbi:MAG: hypothetical protein H0U70_05565 [Tatlockia sp.]|nr:hypothetical protein [Tatlockia sp.]